jgi:hypothetical protein
MVTVQETTAALGSVVRIAMFDRAAVTGFGRDAAACRRSFWAYVIGLPIILLLTGLQVSGTNTETPELLATAQLLAQIIEAAGLPLLLIPVLRRFGRADRWAWFVTSYNWFTLGQIVLSVAVLGLVGGLPITALRLTLGAVNVYTLVVEAFLADAVLDIGGARAAMIVLLDVFLSFGVNRLADWIGGGA